MKVVRRSVNTVVAIWLAVTGVLPAAAHGVSAGEFVGESAVAGLAELGALGLAIVVGMCSSGWETGEDNPAGLAVAVVLAASYPFAAACGAYCVGESFTPSENKGPAFGTTVLAAYGQTFAVGGIAAAVYVTTDVSRGDVIDTAAATDILTKPLLVTYVYNAKKKAAPRRYGRLALEPYFCTAAASDGRAVPIYGVTVSF